MELFSFTNPDTDNYIEDSSDLDASVKSDDSVPRGLQPLLTFPEDNDKKRQTELKSEGLPNPNGSLARYLVNSVGNVRYFGESNPLSFLQECRAVFESVCGSSVFTTDPQISYVNDDPDRRKVLYPVQMPSRPVCDILVKFFKENINDAFYVFDMKYFNEHVLNAYYQNPMGVAPEKLCLLYLVLAVGALFAECSQVVHIEELKDLEPSVFFDSSVCIQNTLLNDVLMWQVEVNYLMFFYFLGMTKRTLAWVHLGLAIRYAQGLGMHRKAINEKYSGKSYNIHRRRLWMSLFIVDRMSSINLGRPLGINYYEWDDLGSIDFLNDPLENLRLRCQVVMSQVAGINGRIVENLYQDGNISLKRASDLAVQLKMWSHDLPEDLDLRTTFHKMNQPDELNINFVLVLVHLSQFYGIMLLCKPFFMYVLLRRLKPLLASTIKNEAFLLHFCKAAIKASFLTINLIDKFAENNIERLELFVITNCCFFASLILAFTLFEQTRQRSPSTEYIEVLQAAVQRGRKVLYDYGAFNATAERWSDNLGNMLTAIFNGKPKWRGNIEEIPKDDFENFNKLIVRMEAEDNCELDDLISFQNTFVPSVALSDGDLGETNLENNLLFDFFLYNHSLAPAGT